MSAADDAGPVKRQMLNMWGRLVLRPVFDQINRALGMASIGGPHLRAMLLIALANVVQFARDHGVGRDTLEQLYREVLDAADVEAAAAAGKARR